MPALHEADAEYADDDRRAVEQRIDGVPIGATMKAATQRAREGRRSACHDTPPDGRRTDSTLRLSACRAANGVLKDALELLEDARQRVAEVVLDEADAASRSPRSSAWMISSCWCTERLTNSAADM